MLGENGTEQFTVETRQDGKLIKSQPIHDPFLTNVTTIAISRWDLFKAIFRRQFITKISVRVIGTEGVQRAIMMLDPKQLEAEAQAILESRRQSREDNAGLYLGYENSAEEMGRLPDGSGFAVMSMPLPEKHWIYQREETTAGPCNVPPMVLRMGSKETITIRFGNDRILNALSKRDFAERIRAAGQYAVRSATMNGKGMDFDPDALLQNLVVGFLGYWTDDGLSSDTWENPKQAWEPPVKAADDLQQAGPELGTKPPPEE